MGLFCGSEEGWPLFSQASLATQAHRLNELSVSSAPGLIHKLSPGHGEHPGCTPSLASELTGQLSANTLFSRCAADLAMEEFLLGLHMWQPDFWGRGAGGNNAFIYSIPSAQR